MSKCFTILFEFHNENCVKVFENLLISLLARILNFTTVSGAELSHPTMGANTVCNAGLRCHSMFSPAQDVAVTVWARSVPQAWQHVETATTCILISLISERLNSFKFALVSLNFVKDAAIHTIALYLILYIRLLALTEPVNLILHTIRIATKRIVFKVKS